MKDNLFILLLILLYFMSPHTYILNGVSRLSVGYILLGLLLLINVLLTKKIRLPSSDNFYASMIIILMIFSVSELLFRGNLERFVGWSVVLLATVMLWVSRFDRIASFIKKYVAVLSLIAFISSIFSMLYILDYNMDGLVVKNSILYNTILHYDSFTSNVNVEIFRKIPRFTGHLQQASLIPAYFLFPLSIALMTVRLRLIIVLPILAFGLLSFSGSVHFIYLMSFFVFLFAKPIRKGGFLLPALFALAVFVFAYHISSIYAVHNDGVSNTAFVRISSGLSRVVILGNQIKEFLTFPVIGLPSSHDNVNTFLLGSMIIGAGIRSGIVGLLLMVYIWYLTISRLLKFKPATFQQRLGFSIAYSCLIMMFVYQDYGFSSTMGFISLSVLMIVLKNKSSNAAAMGLKGFRQEAECA